MQMCWKWEKWQCIEIIFNHYNSIGCYNCSRENEYYSKRLCNYDFLMEFFYFMEICYKYVYIWSWGQSVESNMRKSSKKTVEIRENSTKSIGNRLY